MPAELPPPVSLCASPEHHIVFKPGVEPARILKPGKIGADSAAHKYILLAVHSESAGCKKLLQYRFKAQRLFTHQGNSLRYFNHFINVVLRQRRDIPPQPRGTAQTSALPVP